MSTPIYNKNYKPEKLKNKIFLSYIPHGIDSETFKPLSITNQGKTIQKKKKERGKEIEIYMTEYEEMLEYRHKIFKGNEFDFVVFFNSRNIRRKRPGDIIFSFKLFCEMIGKEKASKCALLMHTAIVDDAGTDLAAVATAIAPECNIIFSGEKVETNFINYMYNLSDVSILISSNEGFGLTLAQSLHTETMVIANVSGGMQDQLGFVDEKGNYLDPDIHFNSEWGSNHDGKYKKCGEFAMAIFPVVRSLVGSPPTPYILDDLVRNEDVADAILKVYNMKPEERQRRGKLGREFVLNPEIGMDAKHMGKRFMNDIDHVLENWKPRERFELIKL